MRLDGDHVCPGPEQVEGQRPAPGPDVNDELTGPDLGVGDDARGPLVNERVPAPRPS
jgi:hypothetical protein